MNSRSKKDPFIGIIIAKKVCINSLQDILVDGNTYLDFKLNLFSRQILHDYMHHSKLVNCISFLLPF